MKNTEITFINKSYGGHLAKRDFKGVAVRPIKNGITLAFYNTGLGKDYWEIGYTDTRVYFKKSVVGVGYKPTKIGTTNDFRLAISINKAPQLAKFVRHQWYELQYDAECDMYYIEEEL